MQIIRKGKKHYYAFKINRKPRVFCISFQRTGTTSVGQFFKDHDFRVATSRMSNSNEWTLKWFKGDYESIFDSLDFRSHQVFEDDPWWCLDFYKILFHRFPNSKFILLERDVDNWFNSMVTHSEGKTLGNTFIHSHIYNREKEFYAISTNSKFYSNETDNLLQLSEEHRVHYTEIYNLRIKQIKDFFEQFGNDRIFCGRLEDPAKWQKIGAFCGFIVDHNYQVHVGARSTNIF